MKRSATLPKTATDSTKTIAVTVRKIVAVNTSEATAVIATAISDTARNAVTKCNEPTQSTTNFETEILETSLTTTEFVM